MHGRLTRDMDNLTMSMVIRSPTSPITRNQVCEAVSCQIVDDNGLIASRDLDKASVASAEFDSVERYPPPKCSSGTRVDVMRKISGWFANDRSHPVYWLTGMAGSGKSAIAQSIAELYAGQGKLAASFFFSRTKAGRNSTHKFFPTIARQLTVSIPLLKPLIHDAVLNDSHIFHKTYDTQFQKLIMNPLLGLKDPLPLTMGIVIDALDESEDGDLACEIVSLLVKASLPFRIFITSRPEPYILAMFCDPETSSLTTPLSLLDFDAGPDIRLFLQRGFADIFNRHPIGRRLPIPWPSDDELRSLVEMSSGLFIFASTVLKFVEGRKGNPKQRLKAVLDKNPGSSPQTPYAGLDQLYYQVYTSSLEAAGDDIKPSLHLIVRTIVLLLDPLPIDELECLLQLPSGDATVALQGLHSVIVVPDEQHLPVRVFHASLRDFLMDPHRANDQSIDIPMHHASITHFCLALMTSELKRDLRDKEDPWMLKSQRGKPIYLTWGEGSGGLKYACRTWATHLAQSHPSSELVSDLKMFTRKSILYWIEALSLLGELDIAIPSLQRASDWLEVSFFQCLCSHLYDLLFH